MLSDPGYEFRLPEVVIYGPGCLARLGEQASSLRLRRPLIVTDPVLWRLAYVDQARDALDGAKIASEVFADVDPEPLVQNVDAGLAMYKEKSCDGLVAVGGGSSIDVAKCIAVLATNGGRVVDYEGVGRVPAPRSPLIAVPTTAGTGSEVTKAAVITDVDRAVKMLIMDSHLTPDVALVDPVLTLSLPPAITMATGIDALTHAIEAYVSRRAHPLTDVLALDAIGLIASSLRQAWAAGDDLAARENMSRGQLQAGMAFSNASVALVHGMARPLGAHFHLSHGLANAVMLATVMEFSLIASPGRYARIAEAMGEETTGLSVTEAARRSVDAVRRLADDIEVPSLSRVGIDLAAIEALAPKMAEDALLSGSPANNPRKATAEQIASLYIKALSA